MILKTNPQEELQIQTILLCSNFLSLFNCCPGDDGGFGDNPSYRSFDVYLSQHTTILWSAV